MSEVQGCRRPGGQAGSQEAAPRLSSTAAGQGPGERVRVHRRRPWAWRASAGEGIAAGCEAWRAVLRRRPAPRRGATTICSPRGRERRSRGGAGAGGRGPPGALPSATRAGARGAHAVVQAPAAGGRQAHQYHAGSVVMLGTTVAASCARRRPWPPGALPFSLQAVAGRLVARHEPRRPPPAAVPRGAAEPALRGGRGDSR